MVTSSELKRLGFSKGTVSEVLLSLSLGNEVNIAPMGVRLGSHAELIVKIFAGCRTYDLVRRGARDYVINISTDPLLFYYAVFNKGMLALRPARYVKAPRLAGCEAYVEAERSAVSHGKDYLILRLSPIYLEYRRTFPKAFNRAAPAIIEALIYYTKIPYLKRSGKIEKAREALDRIRECAEVVEHSTRSRKLRSVMQSIVKAAEEILNA